MARKHSWVISNRRIGEHLTGFPPCQVKAAERLSDDCARRSALAKRLGLGTALRTATAEQSPHMPVKVEEPTCPSQSPSTRLPACRQVPGWRGADWSYPGRGSNREPGRKRLHSSRCGWVRRKKSATSPCSRITQPAMQPVFVGVAARLK